MTSGTHVQNPTQHPIIVQGNVSMPTDGVPVLDIEQLREAVNFLRAGCPAVQLLAKQAWAGGSPADEIERERFPTWTARYQEELEVFLNTVKAPDERFSITSVARAVTGKNVCLVVFTVTRKVAEP